MNLLKQLEYAEQVIKTSAIWEDLISEDDVIKKFSVSASTVKKWRREGLISVKKIGGRVPLYSKKEILSIIDADKASVQTKQSV